MFRSRNLLKSRLLNPYAHHPPVGQMDGTGPQDVKAVKMPDASPLSIENQEAEQNPNEENDMDAADSDISDIQSRVNLVFVQ